MRTPYSIGLAAVVFLVLAAFSVWPELDLVVSGLFYVPEQGFIGPDLWALRALTDTAYYGARALGALFALGAIIALIRRRPWLRLPAKAWLFLLLGLLLGPGLVANVIFKDNWGRARPHTVEAFGGTATYTPPWVLSKACDTNCSFVSGDGAFGFFLPSFAYVVAPARRRRVFWSGMGLGCLFGGARVVMGAHFLSDVLYAAVLMLLVAFLLHRLMYGVSDSGRESLNP